MTSEEGAGRPNSQSDMRASGKKEWHSPRLKKLPIAATSGSPHIGGNDGNTKKKGHAGAVS